MGKSAKELYDEREKRFRAVVSLKRPDRVPITTITGYFLYQYAGLTPKEAMYDYEKSAAAFKESLRKLNWDIAPNHSSIYPGPLFELFGITQFKWPGFNLPDHYDPQWVEDEYMKAEEYDELLADPGDFTIRKLLPRIAKVFEPFANLPPLHWFGSSLTLYPMVGNLAGLPPFVQVLDRLKEIGTEAARFNEVNQRLEKELVEEGFPIIYGSASLAPYDWITDLLRGMKGIMLDMYRNPEKLLAAIDLFTSVALQAPILGSQKIGNPRVFIPLHRGAGGFMSNEQFAKFYWPGLKKIILAIIDAGLTPIVFFEGDYTPRLEFLAELPKCKVVGRFQIVDLNKFKEVLGDTMCFMGNVPSSLLVAGKPQQVKDYVKMLIDTFADTGGLIVDGGTGVPKDCRPENVEAMTEAVFEYGVYR